MVWSGIVTVFKKEFEKGINKVAVKKILTKFYSLWSSYMNVTAQLKLTFCINKLMQPTQGSYIFLSWKRLKTRFVGKFVEKFRSLFRCFTSSQSLPGSTQSSKVKWQPKSFIWSRMLWALRKGKSMILSEHDLKGNGDKLVKEFLSTLESATSWLDIDEYNLCMRVGHKCQLQFNIIL